MAGESIWEQAGGLTGKSPPWQPGARCPPGPGGGGVGRDGHLEVVRLLVEAGADKNKADNDGLTPLFMASHNGLLEIVRLLIDAGADKDQAPFTRYYTGMKPLYIACKKGHLEIVRLLVDAGADKKIVTPSHIKRWRRDHDGIVEMLQRAGATG